MWIRLRTPLDFYRKRCLRARASSIDDPYGKNLISQGKAIQVVGAFPGGMARAD